MSLCKQCGAANGGGRENCWRCGTPLLDIRGVIENDRRVQSALVWAVAGGVVGGAAFLLIFLLLTAGRATPMARADMLPGVTMAGLALGGVSGFFVGILARR